METKKLTILGKSDATLSMIFSNLESNYLFPNIKIINNQNLDVIYEFNNPKFKFEIVGHLESLSSEFIIGAYSPEAKKKIFEYFKIKIDKFINIIHKSSQISSTTEIGSGCLINALSSIGPHTKIGNFVSINGNSLVGHHDVIGDFVTINPGVNIAGHSIIGENTIIGMGTNVLNGVSIRKNVIIGAGSLVVKDIPDNVVAYGSPCKIIRENKII